MSETPGKDPSKTPPASLLMPPRKATAVERSRILGRRKIMGGKIYFDAILFDLDGTLIDSVADIALATNHVRQQMKMSPLNVKLIQSFVGDGTRMLLARALETENEELLDKAFSIWEPFYREHCLDNTCLYRGVEQVLGELGAERIPMGVVSNKMVSFCEQILEGLKIKKYFSTVVGGDSTKERKPHPEPMLFASRQLNVTAKSVLVVGDSANDVISAKEAGYKSCGILWGIGLEKDIRDAKPDYVIHMPSDIPRLIRATIFQ